MPGNQIIPVEHTLPNKLLIIPLLGKPIFPGIFTPMMMASGEDIAVVEKSLVSTGINLSSQILKVGHHGGTSASSPGFLEKVRPLVSIISVGEENYYGYPTERTLSNLQAAGSSVYRTDTCGEIKITTDGLSFSISPEKSCELPA